MNNSTTDGNPTAAKIVPYALLGMTAVTGLVDAVCYLSLGKVFTANMTGNILILAFATVRVSGLSVARCSTALIAFVAGATLGGRIMSQKNPDSIIRLAARAFLFEVLFLSAAAFCGIGYKSDLLELSVQPFFLITLTGLAMGTRNAAVRKLAIPDLTTTVLTLTITGIAADSPLANGNSPRLARRIASVLALLLGAAVGAVIARHSVSVVLALATGISAMCTAVLVRSSRAPAHIAI
jgi:uncharacterized membrane protein YoaK (UPF0700 family)